jgi:enoyl-CoA hydratase/carnithine racemase
MSRKFIEELTLLLDELERDEEVRVIVLTGAGRAFSSGADASMLQDIEGKPVNAKEVMRETDDLALKLANLKKPTIAAVNGIAAGCGMNIALLTDVVIASEKAAFCQIYAQIGMLSDMGGVFNLPRLVGVSKAKELVFTADTIDAKEAERIGLVSKVVSADQLESTVKQLANKMAKRAPLSIEFMKAIMNKGLNTDLSGVCEYEILALPILAASEDAKEGIRAFLEKREPKFKGR